MELLTEVRSICRDDVRAKREFRQNNVNTPVKYTDAEWLQWRKAATHCEICNKEFSRMSQKHGDHNHVTGQWRGVLCFSCNAMIGWVEKIRQLSPDLAKKIKNYLDRKG